MAQEQMELVAKATTSENQQEEHKSSSSESVEIVFKNLNYSVFLVEKIKKGFMKREKIEKEKVILKNISGVFKAGRLTAVMGASGAGKTSLLNLIAGEVNKGAVSGDILVNGEAVIGRAIKKISGFVFQDDVILATMTVREAIAMSATLRLPNSISAEQKMKKVDDLIKTLNLTKCQNTVIGNAQIKGISGGERKRTAMAMELITDPGVLFLDEPTSGLDTFTAYSVIKTLKTLAESGKTIVATIHQPSSEIFFLFDDLLLLSQGRTIYQGELKESVHYFARLGFECPQYTNPSDYIFMSILNNDENSISPYQAKHLDETHAQRLERLLNIWDLSVENKKVLKETEQHSKSGISNAMMKANTDFKTQFEFLFNRASKNAFRNPLIVRGKFMQAIFTAIIIGLIYLNVGDKTGSAAVQDRTGVLFFLIINQVFGNSIGVLSIFGEEKNVFTREFGAGYYSLQSYFFSKIMVEVPFQFIFPFILALIIYFMVGLQANVAKFFILEGFVILSSLVGFSLGICFACLFESLPVALMVTPIVLLPMMLFSGLFLNQGSIPAYVDWIKFITPMKWGFSAISINEYSGLTLYDSAGKAYAGETVIQQLSLDQEYMTIGNAAIILTCMVIFLMVAAYYALHAQTVDALKTIKVKNSSPAATEADVKVDVPQPASAEDKDRPTN